MDLEANASCADKPVSWNRLYVSRVQPSNLRRILSERKGFWPRKKSLDTTRPIDL